MRVTIHQPEHLPWLGFFHKINMADVFVVLDNVQYRRRYFQNRNKIRTNNGWQYITVPLIKENRDALLIKDAEIFNEDQRWKTKNLESVNHSYRKSPYFSDVWDELNAAYRKEYVYLADLNFALIKLLLEKLGIKKEIIFASALNPPGQKSELIFNICKATGAKTYISGIFGKEYLDTEKFASHGIELIFQEFHHPIYKQLYEPFIPGMSAIDLLFNHGSKSLDIIHGLGVPVIDKLFS